jgi:ribosomal protein S6
MKYELFYLIRASDESEFEKIKQSVSEMVASSGGVFEEKETLERRKLSYKIKHETHGIYVAQRFELEDIQKIIEISQKMNLNPKVLRFIISRASELPELLSKEERMANQEKRSVRSEKPRTAEKPAAPYAKEAKKEKKKAATEDIDKKLEEILNI